MNYSATVQKPKFVEFDTVEKFSNRCVKLINTEHIVLVEPLEDNQADYRCLVYLTNGKTLCVDGTFDRVTNKIIE